MLIILQPNTDETSKGFKETWNYLNDLPDLQIKKHGSQKNIIDVTETSFPKSLLCLNDIVKFYTEELPDEMKYWKIAVVDESSYRELGKFWEFVANQQGFMRYKVFASIEEAQEFINI